MNLLTHFFQSACLVAELFLPEAVVSEAEIERGCFAAIHHHRPKTISSLFKLKRFQFKVVLFSTNLVIQFTQTKVL